MKQQIQDLRVVCCFLCEFTIFSEYSIGFKGSPGGFLSLAEDHCWVTGLLINLSL